MISRIRGQSRSFLLIVTGTPLIIILVLLLDGSVGKSKPKLNIAGFFPMNKSHSKWRVGRGVLPAVLQALYDINLNATILPEYDLNILWNDTMCDTGHGMKAFFDMIHRPPLKILLFGDVCTSVTDSIAKASKHWNVIQLSYADTHPMYKKNNFPNLFRIVPSESEFNAPRIELMRLFNWTRVGTLYQNMPLYSLAHNELMMNLEEVKAEVKEAQSFNDDVVQPMHRLKDSGVRIILGNFNETWAQKIFCEAYHNNMYGKRYQWLIVAAYDPAWWKNGVDTNCTLEEIEEALRGALLMDVLPLSTTNEVTVSGRTPSEYNYIYDLISIDYRSRFHGYAYDGIWALALALHNASNFYKGNVKNKKLFLSSFRYRDELWENAIKESLEATSFMGVTGPVEFKDNGRKGSILVKQFQTYNTVNVEVEVGQYDSVNKNISFERYPNKIRWEGNRPPKDRTIQIKEHTRVNFTLFAGFSLMASVGILLACFFLGINIKFRNQRYIKMSSPYLNNLIIIGCVFTYASVILLGLDSKLTSIEAFPYLCTGRAWVLMAGFTLAFGSMFSKTWRVHSIFTNVKLNKKVIKDMQLFIVVGILLVTDFAIMITWQLLDPFYRETKNMTKYIDPLNDDLEIIPEIEYCKSNYMTIFVGCIYAYKGLLMMFGCFLAWETRHVSIPALNDSKYIGMSVYNSVMMCIIGAPLSHVLSEKQDISYVIISIFIIFCTTATLCLVFLPKAIELKRNPKGTVEKRLRTTIKPTFSSSGGRRPSQSSLYEHELKSAKGVNSKYRKQIREIDTEIQALAKILGEEANEILEDAMHLTIPKSDLLKKEDTDVSSLYSLNSDGGDEVYIDEEAASPKKKPVLKYPGIAALTLPNLPLSAVVSSGGQVATTQWSTTSPDPPPLNTTAKTILFASDLKTENEPITIEEKSLLPEKPPESESLLDLYTQLQQHQRQRAASLVSATLSSGQAQQLNQIGSIAGSAEVIHRPPLQTSGEIWNILQKESSRYLENNMLERRGSKPGARKLKSPTGGERFAANMKLCEFGEEIFFEGTDPGIRHSTTNLSGGGNKAGNGIGGGSGGNDGVISGPGTGTGKLHYASSENLPGPPHLLSKYNRSYSVPRKLDTTNIFSEINLDVTLLPIFQKLLTEKATTMSPATANGTSTGPTKSKMMLSCPNILIKCDIVEYL